MTPESVFMVANAIALAAWVLLALWRKPWVADVLARIVVPAGFAALYIVLLAANWGSPGGFSTLGDVATLFANPWLLLAGWVHYLAFDLFVGSWEVRDARARGLSHWAVVPCLVLTFLVGPAGWLLYIVVRAAARPRLVS